MIRAASSRTGQLLWPFDAAQEFKTVNGVVAQGGSMASGGPTVVPCLVVADRPQVDDLVSKALASGGTARPAADEEATYTGSFADPDGHVWQIRWMDQLHVVN